MKCFGLMGVEMFKEISDLGGKGFQGSGARDVRMGFVNMLKGLLHGGEIIGAFIGPRCARHGRV